MELDILRKIGLTEGEIRVYQSLLHLGKSSTGNIMKNSGISSSKVYLILEKLIQKGLVSFIVENNIKKFQVTNPQSILDYIEKEKNELETTKNEFTEIIPKITASLGDHEEESAQIYKGFKGVKVAFDNLLDEMKKGEEYCFFSVGKEEVLNESVVLFFKNFHAKRASKGIIVKGIADIKLKDLYKKEPISTKLYSLRYHKLSLPTGIVIGKNRIIMLLWGNENIAYEIVSKRMVEKYRKFFYSLWNSIK